jgi:hypothetical protein
MIRLLSGIRGGLGLLSDKLPAGLIIFQNPTSILNVSLPAMNNFRVLLTTCRAVRLHHNGWLDESIQSDTWHSVLPHIPLIHPWILGFWFALLLYSAVSIADDLTGES